MSDPLSKLRLAQREFEDRKLPAEWSAPIVDGFISAATVPGMSKSAMITSEDTLRRMGRFDGIRELPPSQDQAISREERAKARLLKRLQSAGLTTTKE